jgi:hypothetical protein
MPPLTASKISIEMNCCKTEAHSRDRGTITQPSQIIPGDRLQEVLGILTAPDWESYHT